MSKSLVILNLTPGDGMGDLVDSSGLQEQIEAVAEGGKTILTTFNYMAAGELQAYGYQCQWLVDDTELATVETEITTFVTAHTFAEAPTWLVVSASSSS
jgi:hypothetical protein